MKNLFLLFNLFLFPFFSNAQLPGLEWGKGIGGTGGDNGFCIAVDGGNVITVGDFIGTVDFDPGPAKFELSSLGKNDIFVLKLDAAGNFLWVKRLGGKKEETPYEMTVDSKGNIYITGDFQDTADFDPGPNVFKLNCAGTDGFLGDVFISKLDASGNFVWAKSIGGTSGDIGVSIAVDDTGNVYTTGSFQIKMDADPGAGVKNLTSIGNRDGFLLKLNSSGNFVWAKNFGGTNNEGGDCIKIDDAGNIILAGFFDKDCDFDFGTGVFKITSKGVNDIFIMKMDGSGNFVWAKSIGGTLEDEVTSMALDISGNIYLTGGFKGTSDFDPGANASNLTSAGDYDIFILKLTMDGNLGWVKTIGGVSGDYARGIAVDLSGNVYTTGMYVGAVDFDPGTGTFLSFKHGANDMFISKLDALGKFGWEVDFGAPNQYETGHSITVDAFGYIYTTGTFSTSFDLDPGVGTSNINSAGSTDIIVHKMNKKAIVGVKKINSMDLVNIFPNPTNDLLNINLSSQFNNLTIEVYNSIAALIYTKQSSQQLNTIPFSDNPKGLYFVKVIDNQKVIASQTILKK